ncbi:hypothetical protein L218DRAFT_999372 [Marasmius fiardii PR-910]|nr:hypothetical protein L218DRAFT_999372 [Marasmius fiardii PR-910]
MLITDVSSRLGEYMLKGWVLTDIPCTTRGCKVPLMRSPSGVTPEVHFCANCQENPGSSRSRSETSTSNSTSGLSEPGTSSQPSTPPTELSSELSSPRFALPPETPESLRRREQSDRASAELGNRLLKGWAMLAEECPNDQCFGVPLVRPPKPGGGEKDPRKECVICGGVYTVERDWAGRERLVPVAVSTESPSEVTPRPPSLNTKTTASGFEGHFTLQAFTTPQLTTQPHVVKETSSIYPTTSVESPPTEPPPTSSPPPRSLPPEITNLAVDDCVDSLQRTLSSLSRRLSVLVDPSLGGAIDPISISSVAESISKTTEALTRVRELQWRENNYAKYGKV